MYRMNLIFLMNLSHRKIILLGKFRNLKGFKVFKKFTLLHGYTQFLGKFNLVV